MRQSSAAAFRPAILLLSSRFSRRHHQECVREVVLHLIADRLPLTRGPLTTTRSHPPVRFVRALLDVFRIRSTSLAEHRPCYRATRSGTVRSLLQWPFAWWPFSASSPCRWMAACYWINGGKRKRQRMPLLLPPPANSSGLTSRMAPWTTAPCRVRPVPRLGTFASSPRRSQGSTDSRMGRTASRLRSIFLPSAVRSPGSAATSK